jgi:hypothetical protein
MAAIAGERIYYDGAMVLEQLGRVLQPRVPWGGSPLQCCTGDHVEVASSDGSGAHIAH